MSEPVPGPVKMAVHETVLAKADTKVAAFEQLPPGIINNIRGFLASNPTSVPAIILILSFLIFGAVAGDRFFRLATLSLILDQTMIVGIIAIAQTLIILTAGIDLSVGVMVVFCSFIMGRLAMGPAGAEGSGIDVFAAILIAILAGGAMGLVNGLLVTRMRLPPFIATLGTFKIFDALKLYYSGSESIRNADLETYTPTLLWFGNIIDFSAGAKITYSAIALILLAILFSYILKWTAWGRHVHAIGDDLDSANLAGIQADRTLVSVYMVAGIICGFAGWLLIGRVGTVSPLAISEANLDSITAVVIGGTSLFGGRGSIVGSVLGALIVGVFSVGLSIAGLDELWKFFTSGVLIIVAVALDQWLRRASL